MVKMQSVEWKKKSKLEAQQDGKERGVEFISRRIPKKHFQPIYREGNNCIDEFQTGW